MNSKRIVQIIFGLLVCGALWFIVTPLDVDRFEADITIENKTAFKLMNNSIMHFGSIRAPNAAERSILLDNMRPFPITTTILIEGPEWLAVSENPVRIDDQPVQVNFTAQPPADAAYGNHSWNVTLVYRPDWFNLFS